MLFKPGDLVKSIQEPFPTGPLVVLAFATVDPIKEKQWGKPYYWVYPLDPAEVPSYIKDYSAGWLEENLELIKSA